LKPIKHLLSLADLSANDLGCMVDSSVRFASSRGVAWTPVSGKIVGIFFRIPSTRTRSSFTVGAIRLGAQTVTYGPNDLQIATGETLEDTGHVLSGYLDALVIRTNNGIAEMREIAKQHEMAVINAMSDSEHPTQAIADLSTLKERFGRLNGIHLLYLGEGNNTAAALALAVSHTPGMKATFVTPEGYGLTDRVIDRARQLAGRRGGTIEQHHDIEELPRNVDAVYATRWRTMGAPHSDPHWIDKFRPFCVTPQIMAKVSKSHNTVFLHDLPAVRGEDVHPEVLNGPQCLAWRQARHKLFSAMAVLEWCLGE